jgi:hypothetical protein
VKSYEEYYAELMNSIFHGKKKKGNSLWATIFFILFIVHVISFYWLLGATSSSGYTGSGWLLAGVLILLGLLFSIIDFIAVLLFIKMQKPHGISKVISYTVLTVICLILAFFALGIILMKYPELVSN